MKDQLINFDTAKLAKEKEFGYDFGGTHYVNGFYSEDGKSYKEFEMQQEDASRCDYYLRHTQSLLQKWLREIHKIEITIEDVWVDKLRNDVNYIPWVSYTVEEEDLNLEDESPIFFKKYEDALEYALQEALNTIK